MCYQYERFLKLKLVCCKISVQTSQNFEIVLFFIMWNQPFQLWNWDSKTRQRGNGAELFVYQDSPRDYSTILTSEQLWEGPTIRWKQRSCLKRSCLTNWAKETIFCLFHCYYAVWFFTAIKIAVITFFLSKVFSEMLEYPSPCTFILVVRKKLHFAPNVFRVIEMPQRR